MPTALTEYVRTCPTCQRVKADHLPPAGLLFPVPVPSRRGGCLSLDFLELPTARSGHDFLRMHAQYRQPDGSKAQSESAQLCRSP